MKRKQFSERPFSYQFLLRKSPFNGQPKNQSIDFYLLYISVVRANPVTKIETQHSLINIIPVFDICVLASRYEIILLLQIALLHLVDDVDDLYKK